MKKKIILVVIGLFIVIQFLPSNKSNDIVTADLMADMNVKTILKDACYDCHSNETVWPWYSKVAPASFFIEHHVEEGKEHLNFSNWEELDSSKQAHLKHEIWEEVEEGEMPLLSYTLLHSEAKLSKEQLTVLKTWTHE